MKRARQSALVLVCRRRTAVRDALVHFALHDSGVFGFRTPLGDRVHHLVGTAECALALLACLDGHGPQQIKSHRPTAPR